MKRNRWLALVLLVLLLVIGGGVTGFFTRTRLSKPQLLCKVVKDKFIITVEEEGVLEPREVTQLTPNHMFGSKAKLSSSMEEEMIEVFSSGEMFVLSSSFGVPSAKDLPLTRFTILRIVPKGTKVNKGDLLVEFDPKPLEDEIEQTEDKLKDLGDNYEQHLNKLIIQRDNLALQVDQARLALEQTLRDYDQLWEEVVTGKISEDSLEFKQRLLQAKKQRINLQDKESRYRIVDVILREYDIAFGHVINKGSIPPKSSSYYPEVLKNEPPEVVSQYLKPLVNIIKRIEDQKKRLTQLQQYPQPLALYAPATGYVFYGSHSQTGWSVRESDIKEGTKVRLKQPVVYVSNTIDMKVTIYVGEDDINKIKPGQKVCLRPNALLNLRLEGEVIDVSEVPVVQDRRRRRWHHRTGTEGKYSVVIHLLASDPQLRPKMNVKVDIFCEEYKDVLFVPQEAVFKKAYSEQSESKDKKVCYIWERGKPAEREVKTGKRNENFIIIKEGLKEGDEIYLYDPFLKK